LEQSIKAKNEKKKKKRTFKYWVLLLVFIYRQGHRRWWQTPLN
jgi:hypothetical protein